MSTIFDSNYRNDPVSQTPIDMAKPMQLLETVKDIFVFELRRYFETEKANGLLLSEQPTIEKYKITDFQQGQDEFVSSVNVIRQLPDVLQKLPILAITAATGRNFVLGLGTQYVGVVQDPPRVLTSRGPWNLLPNSQIQFSTGAGTTIITLTATYVADFTKVQPIELMRAINAQSNIIRAEVNPDSTVLIYLKTPKSQFLTVVAVNLTDYSGTIGSPPDASGVITVDTNQISGISSLGANADAKGLLGLTGQSDDVYNPLRPPKHRYNQSKDLTLNIDVGTEDDNQRTELTDLLNYFLDLRLNERDFALLGDTKLGQNWQIILKQQTVLGGESEIPRPEGDGFSKIYVNRVSIPLVIVDYVDRPAVRPSQILYDPGIVINADQ